MPLINFIEPVIQKKHLYSFKLYDKDGNVPLNLYLNKPLNFRQTVSTESFYNYGQVSMLPTRLTVEPISLRFSIADFYRDTEGDELDIIIEFKKPTTKYSFLDQDEEKYIMNTFNELIFSQQKFPLAEYEVLEENDYGNLITKGKASMYGVIISEFGVTEMSENNFNFSSFELTTKLHMDHFEMN